MVFLKKTLSIILTVALMLTVLPFGLFGLTAAADEIVAPQIETITIGDSTYEIDANKTYAAYDSIEAAINGLEAAASYNDAPEVTFEGQVWDIKSAKLWAHDHAAEYGLSFSECENIRGYCVEDWHIQVANLQRR